MLQTSLKCESPAPSPDFRLHANHLGSTSFVTNHNGAPVQKMLYYPWGQGWVLGGSLHELRFASLGKRDTETGNDHFGGHGPAARR